MTKLAPAKDWRNRSLDKWNVVSFTEYLRDKHREMFGVDYVPFGGTWGMEQGILGDLIGTQSRKNPKPRTASNAAVKRFIDETFDEYQPSKQYPGTSFGFMWTYRKRHWQRIQAEELAEKQREERRKEIEKIKEQQQEQIDDLMDWL